MPSRSDRPPRPIWSYTLAEVSTSAMATSPPTSTTTSSTVPSADCTAYSLAGCGAGSDDGRSRRAALRSCPEQWGLILVTALCVLGGIAAVIFVLAG